MVQAVANAECISLTELMVHLCEEVTAADRVGVERRRCGRANLQQWSLVLDGYKLRVDGGSVIRRDGDDAVLIQMALLEVSEVECAIADDRAAETGSVLRLC